VGLSGAQATWADGGGITGSWKGYMAAARAAFMQQLTAGADADVFEWCMQVAAEDDALSTHSVRAQLSLSGSLHLLDSVA
jgi:hypothetical protein